MIVFSIKYLRSNRKESLSLHVLLLSCSYYFITGIIELGKDKDIDFISGIGLLLYLASLVYIGSKLSIHGYVFLILNGIAYFALRYINHKHKFS